MIVEVHALFSHSSKIGSIVIAKGTKHLSPNVKEPVSHVALLVNGRWVHESTGHSGVRVISYEKWSKINKESARILLGEIEYQVLAEKYRDIQNKKYDFLGVSYLALSIIPTFFGRPLGSKNRWESKNRYFCCEALGYLTGQYYGMSAPIQILEKLKNG